MLLSQLFWRIYLVYALLIALSAMAFVAIVSTTQQAHQLAEAQRHLEQLALVLEQPAQAAVTGSDRDAFAALSDRLRQTGQVRFQLFDAEGRLVGGSDADASSDAWESSDVRRALQFGRGRAFESQGASGPTAYVSIRLVQDEQIQGILRGAAPLYPSSQAANPTSRRIWITAAVISVLGMAITYLVVARIIRPLEQLTEAVERVASGELSPQVHVHTKNEIGTLAAAFNAMSERLTQQIQELQQKRQELEQNNEQLATVLGSMVEGVVAIDANERVILANDAALRVLGLQRSQVVGRPVWEALRQASFHQVLRDAFDGRPLRHVEIELPRQQVTVAVLASRLSGTPSPGVVLVLHDVTDLRRLEEMRRQFVANVSHELKTPLSAIQAYAETLLDGALDDVDCRERFVQRIDEQAARLHKLIVDLLNLQRIESGQVAYDIAPVELEPVVQACADEHQAIAAANDIGLSVEPGPAVEVMADADGLRTILDNLLDNALNYTPAGGTVSVGWKVDDHGVRIEVRDSGVGIPKDHLARIFERFYRIDRARSRELGGTGLGLSIVKHLCQLFGGNIRVESQVGTGSVFTVRLNRANPIDALPAARDNDRQA